MNNHSKNEQPKTANHNGDGRRTFLASSAAAAGVALLSSQPSTAATMKHEDFAGFNLKFAPHPGSFRVLGGKDVIEQIKYCHQVGFRALEYNGLPNQTEEMQSKIGETLKQLNMTMGVFVAYANFIEPTFADRNEESEALILESIRNAVKIAKRVNAKWFTVVPGSVDQQVPTQEANKYGKAILADGYQMANVITLLRKCCEILEPHQLTMVLEPLNWHTNHGGTYLRYSDQAYAICKAVNSPSCKILFDIYHQQITEGNLIANIDHCWDEIAYFQAGDNPGRKEPGTGEINYKNVFQYIYDRSVKEGRDFVVGMEHGNSIRGEAGERALIEAYKKVNPTIS